MVRLLCQREGEYRMDSENSAGYQIPMSCLSEVEHMAMSCLSEVQPCSNLSSPWIREVRELWKALQRWHTSAPEVVQTLKVVMILEARMGHSMTVLRSAEPRLHPRTMQQPCLACT